MAGGPVFCATLYSKLAVVTATVTVKFVKMVSSQNVPKPKRPRPGVWPKRPAGLSVKTSPNKTSPMLIKVFSALRDVEIKCQ